MSDIFPACQIQEFNMHAKVEDSFKMLRFEQVIIHNKIPPAKTERELE